MVGSTLYMLGGVTCDGMFDRVEPCTSLRIIDLAAAPTPLSAPSYIVGPPMKTPRQLPTVDVICGYKLIVFCISPHPDFVNKFPNFEVFDTRSNSWDVPLPELPIRPGPYYINSYLIQDSFLYISLGSRRPPALSLFIDVLLPQLGWQQVQNDVSRPLAFPSAFVQRALVTDDGLCFYPPSSARDISQGVPSMKKLPRKFSKADTRWMPKKWRVPDDPRLGFSSTSFPIGPQLHCLASIWRDAEKPFQYLQFTVSEVKKVKKISAAGESKDACKIIQRRPTLYLMQEIGRDNWRIAAGFPF